MTTTNVGGTEVIVTTQSDGKVVTKCYENGNYTAKMQVTRIKEISFTGLYLKRAERGGINLLLERESQFAIMAQWSTAAQLWGPTPRLPSLPSRNSRLRAITKKKF